MLRTGLKLSRRLRCLIVASFYPLFDDPLAVFCRAESLRQSFSLLDLTQLITEVPEAPQAIRLHVPCGRFFLSQVCSQPFCLSLPMLAYRNRTW